jgi:predicted Na+-dependent transporter
MMAATAPAAAAPPPSQPPPPPADEAPPPTPPSVLMAARVWARARAFMSRHYLPVGLAYSTLFGFLVPAPGIAVSHTPVNTISICGIFFISGLQLQTEEVKKALRAYWAYAYGILAILLLTPLTSLPIAQLPFDPPELPLGQALFMAMPTTVSSGALRVGSAVEAGTA